MFLLTLFIIWQQSSLIMIGIIFAIVLVIFLLVKSYLDSHSRHTIYDIEDEINKL